MEETAVRAGARVDEVVDEVVDLREAYAVARGLWENLESDASDIMRSAEAEADLTRAAANRYASSRMHEVELLVARAKRSLGVAEERSRLMLQAARDESERVVLEARKTAAAIARGEQVAADALPLPSDGSFESELDRMLADALAKALDLPREEHYPRAMPGRQQ